MVKVFSKKNSSLGARHQVGRSVRCAAFLVTGAALLASSACAPWVYPVHYQYRPRPFYRIYVPAPWLLYDYDRPKRDFRGYGKHHFKPFPPYQKGGGGHQQKGGGHGLRR